MPHEPEHRTFPRRLLAASATLVASAVLVACGGGGGSSGGAMPPSLVTPSPSPSGTPPPATSAYDAVIQQYYAGGWGVALGVYKNGVPLYTHGYGFRDRGLPDAFAGSNFWNVPQPDQLFSLPRGAFAADANTVFDLASVSKEFTAGAILLLQQDGKLSVNDPLSTYFPGFPNGDAISLLYLLQHRSGLQEYNNFGDFPDFASAYGAFMTSGQTNYQPIVDRLATFSLKFAPGTQFDYTNTNYVLLGMIVAKVSGAPLGTFLQQRIFGPLGMTHTAQGFAPSPTDLALGYENDGAGPVRSWQWNLQWLAGPGGMTSTVGDLELWDRAVRQPGIFSAASLAQMFAPSPFPQSYGTYADGWFIATLQSHRYLWHDGALGGYQTVNATFPDDGIDIIVLTNDGTGTDPYYAIPQLFAIAVSNGGAPASHRPRTVMRAPSRAG
jgi:CubicO group peptidase (beta-lactamase class C family)